MYSFFFFIFPLKFFPSLYFLLLNTTLPVSYLQIYPVSVIGDYRTLLTSCWFVLFYIFSKISNSFRNLIIFFQWQFLYHSEYCNFSAVSALGTLLWQCLIVSVWVSFCLLVIKISFPVDCATNYQSRYYILI